MQLYKSRGFSEYFGDTFSFLKANGSHFFKHYFIVTGVFLLIILVFGYFFMGFYKEILGGALNNNPNAFEDYMNDNAGLIGIAFILFLLVGLISAVISYAFPPIYLKLYNDNSGNNFGVTDIINAYKMHFGKLIVFLLAGLLLGIILMIPIMIVSFVLMITIIGFLLLPLVVGLVMLLYNGTLIEYIENKKGFFDSFGYSWTLITSKFWSAVGCAGIFYLMSMVIQQIVGLIPYFFGMASMFTTIQDTEPEPNELVSTITIIMMAVFFLSFIVGIFLNNIVQLNQGIIFYSLKEEKENINTKSDIDLIGSGD